MDFLFNNSTKNNHGYILYCDANSSQQCTKIIGNARSKMGIDIRPSQIVQHSFPFQIRGQLPSIFEHLTERYYIGLEEVLQFYRHKLFNDKTLPRTSTNIPNSPFPTTPSAHVFQSPTELDRVDGSEVAHAIKNGHGQYMKMFQRDPSLPSQENIGGGGLPYHN